MLKRSTFVSDLFQIGLLTRSFETEPSSLLLKLYKVRAFHTTTLFEEWLLQNDLSWIVWHFRFERLTKLLPITVYYWLIYIARSTYAWAMEDLLSELSQIYFIKQNPTIMSCSPIFSVLKYKTVERCFNFLSVVCCCSKFFHYLFFAFSSKFFYLIKIDWLWLWKAIFTRVVVVIVL